MTLVAVPETAEGVLAKEEVLVRDGERLMPGQVHDGDTERKAQPSPGVQITRWWLLPPPGWAMSRGGRRLQAVAPTTSFEPDPAPFSPLVAPDLCSRRLGYSQGQETPGTPG